MGETADGVRSQFNRIAGSVRETYKQNPLDRSRFLEVSYQEAGKQMTAWIYPEALRSLVDANSQGFLAGLDFPHQVGLLPELSDVFGIKASLGTLGLYMEVNRNPTMKEPRERILDPFWVYADVFSRRTPDKNVEVQRVSGVRFVDERIRTPPRQVATRGGESLYGSEPTGEETFLQVEYQLGEVLQTGIAERVGRFGSCVGVAPTNEEITGRGDAKWYGITFDDDNFSAVRAHRYWNSDERVLDVDSNRPSDWDLVGVLPLVTFEKP